VRLVLGTSLGFVTSVALLWIAVHRFDWAGPLLANSLRAVLGVGAVAKLEDFAYAVEDRANRVLKKNDPPKTYWKVPRAPAPLSVALPALAPSAPSAKSVAPATAPIFHPRDVGPASKEWSAPGDGEWVRIAEPGHPNEPPHMYKTLLHPDKARSWSEVFVVAIDLARVRLFAVAGTQEPQADSEEAKRYVRDGRIPAEQQAELLAAFNGGFMTEHGGYGMKIGSETIAKPRRNACVIARYDDDSMRVAAWEKVLEGEPHMLWFRQTPECMWENDMLHAGLRAGAGLKKWGSTVDGETVIRRSAVGLNRERDVLYVAITNHTSARVLAEGMHHAGASDVAQLDVNWSYPKFVTFEPIGHTQILHPVPLAPGFEYSDDEYLRKKEKRDFFYLLRKVPDSKPTP
jgi:hypothetical protein